MRLPETRESRQRVKILDVYVDRASMMEAPERLDGFIAEGARRYHAPGWARRLVSAGRHQSPNDGFDSGHGHRQAAQG